MKRTLSALALVAGLLPCSAQAFPGRSHLLQVTSTLDGQNPFLFGEWVALLPRIASDCQMKVVKSQLFNVTSQVRRQDSLEVVVDGMLNKGSHNDLLDDWEGFIRSNGTTEACATANSLWGEDGDQFPGVLRIL